MVVPISNSRNYIICPYCNSPELLSGFSGEQANNAIRNCAYCGQEIYRDDTDINLKEKFYFQMRFLTYRDIYHILKKTMLLEKNTNKLDLTEVDISKIVEHLRKKTINGSFLVDLNDKFPRGQLPQIRRLYQETREEQQQEQLFNDEYRILFEEATMDTFSIICGDQNYSDIPDIQKRIVTNIIQEDGFNPEGKDKNNSFNQQAWFFAAFYIHHILTERENVSYSNLESILSPTRINEIAQEFTDVFTGDLILEKWDWKAIELKKSRFENELKSLQLNLKRDWVFRESFVAQAKRLIMFISQLIRGEIEINLVKDLEKKVVEKLIDDLNIDNNSHISSIFKFNFMLVITRFVYFILRTNPNGPPLGKDLMESEDPIEQKFTWYIKREMLKSESIDESFLKNLHVMEIKDFNDTFSTIKRDIKKDFIFSMSFNGYLESMIEQVITLISSTKKKSRHSLDELAIIENLANYNFQWKERELTDEEIDAEVDDEVGDDVIEKESTVLSNNINTRVSNQRVKIPEYEKKIIKTELSCGIPKQRIQQIINNYRDSFEDRFIERLDSYLNKMPYTNVNSLSLGIKHVGSLISGFENMIYLDRSISIDSVKKIELLLNRDIQVIKNWRKPRRERISGLRIQITEEGIKTIKNELSSGIPTQRLSKIINEYNIEDNFIKYLKKLHKIALESGKKEVRIHLTKMGRFITNWENILYRGYVISELDFNKLKLLMGKENSISHLEVYGKKNLEVVKLIKNRTHAELIGTFIVRGSIRTDRNDLYISYNSDDHPDYISHIEKLITQVFGRSPSNMGTRDRFYISGPDIIQYLASQDLSNENRRVPSWILKSPSWIQNNFLEWKEKYVPLVIACLRGMINGSGSIRVASRQDRIEISLSKSDRFILLDFKNMCNSLNIETSGIKKQIRKDGRVGYYIYIISRNQVRAFLIDHIRPLKWDCIKENIQTILNDRGSSIELVLELTPEFNELRRKLFKHQKQQYTFLFNPTRIKNINNKILRDNYSKYIKNISLDIFPSHQFDVKNNIRSSSLKFVGEHIKDKNGNTIHREVIKTDMIKDFLINNNPHIEIFHYNNLAEGFYKDLLDIVRQVYDEFRIKKLGRPWHEPILKKIMVRFPFAMASEIPVWKKLKSGNYYVGHVDLNLIDEDTFFVADLKDDEVDIIKSLIQIASYGINQKRLIFSERKNIDPIMFRCIAFTKNELWVFNPETLRHDIIKFTRYANSLREKNLKSLPFSKGEKRTDLLEDIEKTVFFLQNIIDNDDKNDLDE